VISGLCLTRVIMAGVRIHHDLIDRSGEHLGDCSFITRRLVAFQALVWSGHHPCMILCHDIPAGSGQVCRGAAPV
jgi:hypothetical protein